MFAGLSSQSFTKVDRENVSKPVIISWILSCKSVDGLFGISVLVVVHSPKSNILEKKLKAS